MIEKGVIIEKNSKTMKISIQKEGNCVGCAACKELKSFENDKMILEIPTKEEFSVGDEVNVKIENENPIGSIFAIFGLPIVMMLVGFIIGYYIKTFIKINIGSDKVGVIVSIIFLVIGFIVGIIWDKKKSKNVVIELVTYNGKE